MIVDIKASMAASLDPGLLMCLAKKKKEKKGSHFRSRGPSLFARITSKDIGLGLGQREMSFLGTGNQRTMKFLFSGMRCKQILFINMAVRCNNQSSFLNSQAH